MAYSASTSSSILSKSVSSLKQVLSIEGDRIAFRISNSMRSPPTWSESLPFCTSIRQPAVARNGLPRRIGMFWSSSISITTKSAGMKRLPTCIGTSSIIPKGYRTDLSANCKVILVGFRSPIPILSNRDLGIRLTLAPKSHKALSIDSSPITHGIEKLPGSLSFGGSLLSSSALHSSVKAIVSHPEISLFLDRISFKNLA